MVLNFIDEKNPWASFIFIGAQLQGESQENTKRFRVYKMVMENFFKPTEFDHYLNGKSSIYIILNKLKIEDDPEALKHIEKMAVEYYEIEGKDGDATEKT